MGNPVLYFHGCPGSAGEAAFLDEAATASGISLLAIDRPGLGGSSPHPGRTFASWTEDVHALIDHLRIQRAGILAFSGGAPYALECAWRLAPRIDRVGLLSPFVAFPRAAGALSPAAMTMRLRLLLFRRLGFLLRLPFGRLAHRLGQGDARHDDRILAGLDAADAEVLGQGENRRRFLAASRAAFRQGPAPLIEDLKIIAAPVDQRALAATMPLRLWIGGRDRRIPTALENDFRRLFRDVSVSLLRDAGHYLLAVDADAICRFFTTDPPLHANGGAP